MMSESESEEIRRLHALYCELTGYALPLRYDRERAWHDWARAGNTDDDLRLVIRWILVGIRNAREQGDTTHRRNQGALRFSNLICQLDLFDEQLAAARAWAAPRRRAQAAPTTRRPAPNAAEYQAHRQRIAALRRRLCQGEFTDDQ